MRDYVKFWVSADFAQDDMGNTTTFNSVSASLDSHQDVVDYNFRLRGLDQGNWTLTPPSPIAFWCKLSKEIVVFFLQQNDAAFNGVDASNLNFIVTKSPRTHPDRADTFLKDILYLGQPVSPQ